MKKLTNGDIGGVGSKIWHFCGDVIFEWSLMSYSSSPANKCMLKVKCDQS